MANPSVPDPILGGDIPSETPPRTFPGERPLGQDEPSALYKDAPIVEPLQPGVGPDHMPWGTHGPSDTRLSATMQAYEAHAVQEAIESGMARSELLTILGSLSATQFVPPHAGEPLTDYAARATGELMVRYLAQDHYGTAPRLTGRP